MISNEVCDQRLFQIYVAGLFLMLSRPKKIDGRWVSNWEFEICWDPRLIQSNFLHECDFSIPRKVYIWYLNAAFGTGLPCQCQRVCM